MKITLDKDNIKSTALGAIKNINKSGEKVREQASETAKSISQKAGEMKADAIKAKKDVEDKITKLDRELADATTQYNDAYTQMNDKGIRLYVERNRSIDLIVNVECLINSIANHPKEFDKDFQMIREERQKFTDSCEYAERDVQNARQAASGAGAGLAAGASVAFMGPTAAMWVATTFGTASTGAAISTLSGAAATNAALAWLGGGTLAAGGGGIVGGQALLALAGPVGWTIAGASLLGSIVLFSKNKMKSNKQKSEEIKQVKQNTERVREMDQKMEALMKETSQMRGGITDSYHSGLALYSGNYSDFSAEDKSLLGSLVNNTRTLSVLLNKTIG